MAISVYAARLSATHTRDDPVFSAVRTLVCVCVCVCVLCNSADSAGGSVQTSAGNILPGGLGVATLVPATDRD